MNANRLAAALALLLGAAFVPVALACDLPWQPTSARYEPPDRPGDVATLILGPDVCVLFYEPVLAPPAVIVTTSGQNITVTAGLMDLSGIGVSPPPKPVEIPIAALAPGEYRLLTRLTASGFPIPDANLPLSVAGVAAIALPSNAWWLLIGIGVLVLLTAWVRLRRVGAVASGAGT